MRDLSILIPARNEMFLSRTIDNLLDNIEADTEIIAVLDGAWADPPIKDHPRITLVHHTQSIGQRAVTNEAARMSKARYIMKLDGHCAVDKGFDVKLMKHCEPDWTVIPRMYNLHAFDWKCFGCGNKTYQGPTPVKCVVCGTEGPFEREMVWKPRTNRRSDFARFDGDLKFQYWRDYEKRSESKGDIADCMSSIGACWFMHRRRYLKLGGLDENHGSWGQVGTEMACKSWLSGGRHVVNKTAWFSHMFRTQGGDFGFPYPLSGKDVDKARAYSRHLWIDGKWKHAVLPLSWMINKFSPVPGWDAAGGKGEEHANPVCEPSEAAGGNSPVQHDVHPWKRDRPGGHAEGDADRNRQAVI